MKRNRTDPAENCVTINTQTAIVLVGLVLTAISIGFIVSGQIREGFRQQALLINQNYASLVAKSDADFKALLRGGDDDSRELIGVIEDRRSETD